MVAGLLVRAVHREHVPVPPRHREVLERGPAHGRTQPAAHRAGGHGGVVRPVARPAGRVEGPDVVSPRHVPERDAGLDVADTEPRGGLPHPAEEEEVLPVRALEPDVLEREGRLCRALPAGPLDLDGLENSLGQEPPVALSADASSLACVYVWCVVRGARGACGAWCVVCGACGMRGVRSTQKGTRKQHAKDLRKKHTQKAQPELRHGGKMNRRVSHAANLRHVDDERIRRDAYVSAHFHHPLIHGHHMYISQQSPKPAPRANTRSSHAHIALKSKACTAH